MATIRDVARRAGVSHTAVSAVINGNSRGTVGPEKLKKIQQAIRELGYRPSRVARQLATGKSNIIAVCFGMPFPQVLMHPSNSAILAAIGSSVSADGYHLLMASAGDSVYTDGDHTFVTSTGRQGIEQVLAELASQGVGGVIVVGPIELSRKTVFSAIDNCGVPTVCIDSYREFAEASTVDADNATAVRLAIEHLVSQGHSRISYLTPPPTYQYLVDRMTSFCAELQARGIAMTEHTLRVLECERVPSALCASLRSDDRPTAIICATGMHGAAAVQAVASCRLRMPEDISLIIFDELPQDITGSGAVSLIRVDPQAMGSKAADILKAIVSGETTGRVNARMPMQLGFEPASKSGVAAQSQGLPEESAEVPLSKGERAETR